MYECFILCLLIVLPDAPRLSNNELVCTAQGEGTAQYHMEWEPPENINSFDLGYYEIEVQTDGMNTTEIINSYNNSILIGFDQTVTRVNVGINAVSRCGQRSTSGMTSLQLRCTLACSRSSSQSLSVLPPLMPLLIFFVYSLLTTTA